MFLAAECGALAATPATPTDFPPALDNYNDGQVATLWSVLQNRIEREPFNLWATLLFLGAVVHTFLTHRFARWAHTLEARARAKQRERSADSGVQSGFAGMLPRLLHFFGEVEAVFGIWVIPLLVLMVWRVGWPRAMGYLEHRGGYAEALFVFVIMTVSSTRPVIQLAEQVMSFFARLGGAGPAAWWWVILTLGPLLGSLITEPAAMTISALLLTRQFYCRKPGLPLAYATLALLFVNVSVGGVMTHFAAPPVLMVAGPWNWNTPFMFRHFGWIAALGIVTANLLYFLVFRTEISRLGGGASKLGVRTVDDLNGKASADPAAQPVASGFVPEPQPSQFSPAPTCGASRPPVPFWVTLGHLLFMAWFVFNSHHPVLLVGGFLFFIAFFDVTAEFQTELQLRAPIMVGFFLAGLVVHGGLQAWWIAPVLGRLAALPLMAGAIGLTAFNDNAAVTYLATLVPDLTERLKYAVVAGAVTGGGLTVIANAPNPAGQSILGRYFPDGISPLGLFLGALPPTIILALCFLLLG